MVFAAEIICPMTIALVVGVLWFAGWIGYLRHQRTKHEQEGASGTSVGGDTSPVRESRHG